MKGQIADMMEGQGGAKGKKAGAGSRFSVEELKELFKLRLDTPSDTHDLLCKGTAVTGMNQLMHTVRLAFAFKDRSNAGQQSIVQGCHTVRMNSCSRSCLTLLRKGCAAMDASCQLCCAAS